MRSGHLCFKVVNSTCCSLINLCLLLLSNFIFTFYLIAQFDGSKANMVRWINRLLASTNKYFIFLNSKTEQLCKVLDKKENQPEHFVSSIFGGSICFICWYVSGSVICFSHLEKAKLGCCISYLEAFQIFMSELTTNPIGL